MLGLFIFGRSINFLLSQQQEFPILHVCLRCATLSKPCITHLFQTLAELLQLSSKEAGSVFSKIKKYLVLIEGESHVSFKSDLTLSIVDFVSCFECRVQKMEDKDNETIETTASNLTALVLPGLSDVKKTKLGEMTLCKD